MELTFEQFDKATSAAAKIRRDLLARVLGRTLHLPPYGPTEVLDIIPSRWAAQLGLMQDWRLKLKNLGDRAERELHVYLNHEFTLRELLPLFRNTFAPIGLPVARPMAEAHFDEHNITGGKFAGGGRLELVLVDQTVYLQPAGTDPMRSSWLKAAIHIKPSIARFRPPFVSCTLEPSHDTEDVRRFTLKQWPLTFFLYEGAIEHSGDWYQPIARVTRVSSNCILLEQAKGVELCHERSPNA